MEDILKFEKPKNQSSIIKVLGVGGGGGNAVNHMFNQGITGVDFIVCNTDAQALDMSPVPNKISLGNKGLGAGSVPSIAEKAAIEKTEVIKKALSSNTEMLFITAGMGGGTGTGAAPIIARLAKEIELPEDEGGNILVIAIVTLPFSFEGRKRK
jgi:cell division protein FtsZ